MSSRILWCCLLLIVAPLQAEDASCGGWLSASNPVHVTANYSADCFSLCDEKGRHFPANQTFAVWTRLFDWNPLSETSLSDLTKHQYYLVDKYTGQRFNGSYYLTTTKQGTPHFPKCIQADGIEHPKFVTSCFGRCGAGCGKKEQEFEEAGMQSIGVGYTSTDYFAGKGDEYDCHAGCWLHDLCIYAKLCPQSVQWVNDAGVPVAAPQRVMDQCNALTNPSIFKCGALEYVPLRHRMRHRMRSGPTPKGTRGTV